MVSEQKRGLGPPTLRAREMVAPALAVGRAHAAGLAAALRYGQLGSTAVLEQPRVPGHGDHAEPAVHEAVRLHPGANVHPGHDPGRGRRSPDPFDRVRVGALLVGPPMVGHDGQPQRNREVARSDVEPVEPGRLRNGLDVRSPSAVSIIASAATRDRSSRSSPME